MHLPRNDPLDAHPLSLPLRVGAHVKKIIPRVSTACLSLLPKGEHAISLSQKAQRQ